MNPIEPSAQPIDALMTKLNISNAELVAASTRQLTFKVVQKARKGKPLTPNLQMKVLEAMNALKPERAFSLKDLFNYG